MSLDQQPVSFWRPAESEPSAPTEPTGAPSWLKRFTRERPLFLPARTTLLIDLAIFAGLLVVMLIYFRPGLLLSVTTTTGGDTAAHVYMPWYLREHLLPNLQLAGWSPDWYAGFPILHFYFPLIAVFQVVLSYLIPYEVAFKLGTVTGPFFFPVAAYLLFRLVRLRFPAPIVGAAFALSFLFMTSFTIYGGNIASTLAGEYSFSLSLGLTLVFYGLAYRLATEERARPLLAALVLALAVLSHLVPVVMVVLTAPWLVYRAIRTHGARTALARFGVVFGTAFAFTAFWSIPFLARLGYTTDMRWGPLEGWGNLFPRELWIFAGLALAGAVLAWARRDDRFVLFAAPALAGAVIYFFLPQGHVWNGRFLPFFYVGVYLCAAYAAGTILPGLARALWRRRASVVAASLACVVALGTGGWLLWNMKNTFVDFWIEYNYEGYENKAAYPVFSALMERLEELPSGRVMWEPSPELERFGSTIALMTIPYWTGLPTMEGIYFESSRTTPFHFLTAAELAQSPSNPIPDLPYGTFNLDRGLDHLELMDVSYYVTFSDIAKRQAMESDRLEPVGTAGAFSIFAVDSPGQVVVPRYEPVVLSGRGWVDANLEWFAADPTPSIPLVRSGPDEWARSDSPAGLPRRELPHGGRAFAAEMGRDEISFRTTAVGEPHWVKTSYFPNWRVEGAEGPYEASPSLMMVVPTEEDVRLYYARTWAEWLGLVLSLGMIVACAVPVSRRRIGKKGGA